MTVQKKIVELKNKIINNLISNGMKTKSEKTLTDSIKLLQRVSKKPFKKIVQLALAFNTPIFKLNIITQKKRKKKKLKTKIIPGFILNKLSRLSLAVKLILKVARAKKALPFFKKFQEELIIAAQNKSLALEKKKEMQKQAVSNRRLFKNYRWH